MWPILVSLLVLAAQAREPRPTLADTLRAGSLPMPPGTAGTEPIWNVGVLDDSQWYVIAYYRDAPQAVRPMLLIRAFDKRGRRWRFATFDEIGSVLSIRRAGRLFYVEGHESPSATPLLVLDERLTLKRRLDGWPELVLADGRVLFNRSMRHFAPTHAEVLAVYDPATNRDVTVYPSNVVNDRGAEQRGRDVWIDRTVSDVQNGPAAGTVRFRVQEQRMRLDADQAAHPIASEEDFRVACDLATRACRRLPLAPAPARR